MPKRPLRIGILGGTFNPVHNGHIKLARRVKSALKLNRVYLIPVYMPPHKKAEPGASAADRLAMVKSAVKGNRGFYVSSFEVRSKGVSYSVRTLEAFRKRFGRKAVIFFIIGSDSLEGLRSWKEIDRVKEMATFAVIRRPGYSTKKLPCGSILISMPPTELSSSVIRKRIRIGASYAGMVPIGVRAYIERKGLYKKNII